MSTPPAARGDATGLPLEPSPLPPKPPRKPHSTKRKRCLNCGKIFVLTRGNRRFCTNQGEGNCKDEWHANGKTAFGPLRSLIDKTMSVYVREVRERMNEIDRRLHVLERAADPALKLLVDALRPLVDKQVEAKTK